MKIVFFIVSFFCLFNTVAYGQSAESILDKSIAATGGKEMWNRLSSIELEGEVSIDVGESKRIKIYHQRPSLIRVVFIENGEEKLNEGYDGEKAWTYDPVSKTNVEVKSYQPNTFESDILNYEKKGFKADYLGKETIKNKECYKVKLTKNKNVTTYYFDVKTGFLLFEENMEETIFYEDYKPVGGLLFAYTIIGRPHGGKEYKVRFKKITPNPNFSAHLFKFKKKA